MSKQCIQFKEFADELNTTCALSDEYEFSPLAIAIESKSIDEVSEINVTKNNSEFKIAMKIRFKNDLRWHCLCDTIYDETVTRQFLKDIISQTAENNKLSKDTSLAWIEELNRLKFAGIQLRA